MGKRNGGQGDTRRGDKGTTVLHRLLVPSPPCLFVYISQLPISEDDLQRELQLPRRAGVAGWESGGVGYVDEPKGCASHHGDTPRLPKVRMVEEVEDLSPELDAQILGNPGVLEEREIHVFEVWSGDDISAQVAKVEDAAARYRQRKDRAGGAETGGG